MSTTEYIGKEKARAGQPVRETAIPHGGVQSLAEPVIAGAIGGDGGVTAFHDNGGKLLLNCRVVLVFWGSDWGNAGTNPSANSFSKALSDIVYGPWGTQLNQYRGIGTMSVEQTSLVTNSDPPASFTNANIQSMLTNQFNLNTLPAPDSSIDRLYCVLMPTGHSSGDTPFVGQHQFYNYNGTRVYYAWVSNDGTLTGGNSIPKVFSHELAEAVSDPDLGSGILVDVGTDTNEEIGDVCNNTWTTVDGAAHEAYWSEVDNRCVNPLNTPFPAVTGNPVLIQGRFGTQGNFELLAPLASGGLAYFWRNNNTPFVPWSLPKTFGQSLGAVDAVTMIESNFGSPGNLEVVARSGGQLFFFWRDSGPTFSWSSPIPMGFFDVSGNPALIQGRFGTQGNFEMVSPLATGGLAHYFRDNDATGLPWYGPFIFAEDLGHVDAVTMIQSNFGSPGNLELVARSGDQLYFFWRDSGPLFNWYGPIPFGQAGVSGNPVLIQSRFGTQGNFELIVPLSSGGLAHYFRDNDASGFPWSGPFVFAQNLGPLDAVSLIQSNYGNPGNLEVVARAGSQLYFLWRDSGPAFLWNGPFLMESVTW